MTNRIKHLVESFLDNAFPIKDRQIDPAIDAGMKTADEIMEPDTDGLEVHEETNPFAKPTDIKVGNKTLMQGAYESERFKSFLPVLKKLIANNQATEPNGTVWTMQESPNLFAFFANRKVVATGRNLERAIMSLVGYFNRLDTANSKTQAKAGRATANRKNPAWDADDRRAYINDRRERFRAMGSDMPVGKTAAKPATKTAAKPKPAAATASRKEQHRRLFQDRIGSRMAAESIEQSLLDALNECAGEDRAGMITHTFVVDTSGNIGQMSSNYQLDADWINEATQSLLDRTSTGERWNTVVQDLSRHFAEFFDGAVQAYDFASDAFTRRCWEMGLVVEQVIADSIATGTPLREGGIAGLRGETAPSRRTGLRVVVFHARDPLREAKVVRIGERLRRERGVEARCWLTPVI